MPQSEERTELPSDYKKQKAKEEGNVGKSQEVTGFVTLLFGLSSIFVMLPFFASRIGNIFVYVMSLIQGEFSDIDTTNLAFFLIKETIFIAIPIFFILILAGMFGNIIQFGFIFTTKTIIPKLSKINMVTGLKNLVSIKKILDGLLITSKVFIAFIVGSFVFFSFLKEIPNVAFLDIFSQVFWLKDKSLFLGCTLLILFFFLASLDFYIRRRQYIESLRMTKQEVKDEYKQLQGNPQIRARIRQTMRKMSSKKMLSNVPKATVVITNPTHYAVAIKFVLNEDIAPVVVAKGTDLLAIRIKEIAREFNIPVVEQPKLARDLYRLCDIDDYIPEELFRAVAEVFRATDEISSRLNPNV